MPYESDVSRRTLQAMVVNNDLLELLIEVQLAALESYETFVTLNAKLERIAERRETDKLREAAELERILKGRDIPDRPAPNVMELS